MLFQNTEHSTQRQTLDSPHTSQIKTTYSQHLPSAILLLPVATVYAYFLPKGAIRGSESF
jgi:hypothetical protein